MVKTKIKPRFTPPTTEQLHAQATAYQAAQRYKELIEVYKELLKREDRQEWREGLAQAYGLRARALAAKGMYREAVAMWESSRTPASTEWDTAVVAWMLAAGMYSQAARLIQEIPVLPQELQIRLGVVLLIGHEGSRELQAVLPDDSPLLRHLEPARAALAAWCRGDDAVVREQLRTLPFRSPYRELRQVLQGLLATDKEPLEAITATSPYAGLARAALAAHASLVDLERRLAALRPAEQELAAVLRGVDPMQLRVVLDLRATLTSNEENLAPLFRWVSTKPSPVAEEQARRFALAILPHQPHLLDFFQKRFTPLTPFEHARLRALLAERDEDLEKAQKFWKNTFAACDLKDATGALMGAMILRHQATLELQMYGPESEKISRYLSQSLQLDPLDRATWLELVKNQRENGHVKWYLIAERALTHLPEDADLLLLAAQGASERSAYKKASNYVTTLLRLDPINSKARRLLINLHLSHARKSLKNTKIPIAARELESAHQLAHGDADTTRIAVHQALIALAQHQSQEAREFAVQAARGPAGSMGMTLLLRVEGPQAGFKPSDLAPLYKNLIETLPTANQVMALLDLLEELLPIYPDLVPYVLNTVIPAPLQAAASHQTYTEEQLTRLFEMLLRCSQWDALGAYATTALERWPGRPLFMLYYYMGISHDHSQRLAPRDIKVLEDASTTAFEAKDHNTARMIDEFLGMLPFQRMFPRPHPQQRYPEPSSLLQQIMDVEREGFPEEISGILGSIFERIMEERDSSKNPRGRGRRPAK